MKDLAFIIPIRVDTEDRVENCLTILRFLEIHFPESEILLMEQDSEIRTERIVKTFPKVRRNFDLNDGRFSKSKAVNDGILLTHRSLICMSDTDILLHPNAIHKAAKYLRAHNNRVVIPHNKIFLDITGKLKEEISQSLDMDKYGNFRKLSEAPINEDLTLRVNNGGIFIATKNVLLLAGGLNKKMISYGWEDAEFTRRLDKLGYYSFLLPEFNLVHLNHRRGKDSQINELYDVNKREFDKVSSMTRSELEAYVESDLDIASSDFIKKRSSFRSQTAIFNLSSFDWLNHIINKVYITIQINGFTKLLRRFFNAS